MNIFGALQIWGPRANARIAHAVMRPWLTYIKKHFIKFCKDSTKITATRPISTSYIQQKINFEKIAFKV